MFAPFRGFSSRRGERPSPLRCFPLQSRLETLNLSESAVANLRVRTKGFPLREQDLAAYREPVDAGIMEPASGTDYRFTPWGMEHREEILEIETERIERDRMAPNTVE